MEIDYIIKENDETKYLLGYDDRAELAYYIVKPYTNYKWYYNVNDISNNNNKNYMSHLNFLDSYCNLSFFINKLKNEKLTKKEKEAIADICKTMHEYRRLADLSDRGHSNIALYDEEINIVKNKELYEQCNEQINKLWNLLIKIFKNNYNI